MRDLESKLKLLDYIDELAKRNNVHPVCILCAKQCKKKYSFWSFQMPPSMFCDEFTDRELLDALIKEDDILRRRLIDLLYATNDLLAYLRRYKKYRNVPKLAFVITKDILEYIREHLKTKEE